MEGAPNNHEVSQLSKHYEILEIDTETTYDNFLKAFRDKALLTHPDQGGDAEMFTAVYEAYVAIKKHFETEEPVKTTPEETEFVLLIEKQLRELKQLDAYKSHANAEKDNASRGKQIDTKV